MKFEKIDHHHETCDQGFTSSAGGDEKSQVIHNLESEKKDFILNQLESKIRELQPYFRFFTKI